MLYWNLCVQKRADILLWDRSLCHHLNKTTKIATYLAKDIQYRSAYILYNHLLVFHWPLEIHKGDFRSWLVCESESTLAKMPLESQCTMKSLHRARHFPTSPTLVVQNMKIQAYSTAWSPTKLQSIRKVALPRLPI